MIDYLRIHVLWANGSDEGARVAELISTHFDGIGMEREGVAHRVPVRFASAPWQAEGATPAPVDFDRAAHNAVVLLHDDFMHEACDAWDDYIAKVKVEMGTRGGVDVYIPFGSPSGEPPLTSDSDMHVQYAFRSKWRTLPDEYARDKRLILHLLFQVRRHLRAVEGNTREVTALRARSSISSSQPVTTYRSTLSTTPWSSTQERIFRLDLRMRSKTRR
jgi:hypothetical protein